ncbi:MarC family NAAT transporter [Achromobacter sp. Marseille-Q0513]|uniref:MarC family NAAT transporter n=1 Tax=Achromobacter sp. Marseille-Q0513 TaxID=2829161 RepID=UPI001BA09F6C|nr:MarC family NAAT transporter [Achromobacter sp. Marseille-Q0513]MBR8656266.1 MarC family NAAT transporter [Achromobacter sp. Marseille-Q0513]
MFNDLFLLGKLTGLGLVIMLPLANPLTSMTMLLSLGQHIPYKERARQIRQAAFYVVGIMLVTYYAGAWIMSTFGISIPGLRIAGGLIVMVLGFSMLFPKTQPEDAPEVEQTDAAARRGAAPNIAFVPLAMPGTAGPGTIAMIISAASSMNSDELAHVPAWVLAVVPIVVFALLGLIFWICLTSAGKIVALIGHEGVEAISRVMGFLLVCMGVQFVINGVLEIAHGLP